ncbi:MAG: hypothetical protein II630_07320, partial [Bacteroidales bacterium]|nr:hypothetical protein [Bacteroidales bacterium]
GRNAKATPDVATAKNSVIAIGADAVITSGEDKIQLGTGTNSTNHTMQVCNYTLLDTSTGTIPTDRLTKVNTTITLAAADWSSNTQTVTVNGVTSTSIVWVSPDPTDQSAYVSAGILCSAQGTDSLTFTATTTPSADIDVVVVAM